jgi:hypothetical protein
MSRIKGVLTERFNGYNDAIKTAGTQILLPSVLIDSYECSMKAKIDEGDRKWRKKNGFIHRRVSLMT